MSTVFYHQLVFRYRYLSVLGLHLCVFSLFPLIASASSITYATRLDAISWGFTGSKFACQLSHSINDFGTAIFERKAGEQTRFVLESQSPRMKSGDAMLVSQPPMWFNDGQPLTLASVNVDHGITPVTIQRKTSERMLAELQKGMDLHFLRDPWYGDKQSLKVIIPSIGFRKSHSDYLACLGNLLPVNFSQIQRKSLYYSNEDEKLSTRVTRYLDKVAAYMKEDSSVKSVYIDGHTDSEGVRSENLLKSKERAERVMDYLLAKGVPEGALVVRWHGERYQVASNQNNKSRAKNRRVTLRLSKEPPRQVVAKAQSQQKLPNTVDTMTKEESAPKQGNIESDQKVDEATAN